MKRLIVILVIGLLLSVSQAYAGNGNLIVDGEIKVGNSGAPCNSTIAGSIHYNLVSNIIEFCNGISWVGFGSTQTTTSTSSSTSSTPPTASPSPISTASPVGGTYATTQSVTLASNVAANIYYTTNGTTPTTSSPTYNGAISIPTTTTLKYLAKDSAGNTEALNTQVYTINPTASDSGSIVASSPGQYAHTFTTNATVTVAYISGEGGGAGYWEENDDGINGGNALIVYDGVTITTAFGGGGGDGIEDYNNGVNGSGLSSVDGTVQVGGGGMGEVNGDGGNGGNGGKVVGGSFNVMVGKVLTVSIPHSTMGNGSVSLSWK